MRNLLLVAACCLFLEPAVRAADTWIEVKSAHFTVVSSAGERATRRLVWQLEQVRSAMASIWSWARVDLTRPLAVIAVGNENSLKALAPAYWEGRRAIRPESVWVSGVDQHYLAIRTDVQAEDRDNINPHLTAYFSYIGLVMGQSLSPDLPLWFSRGFTGVLSNTIVRDEFILVGAPIPWHLQSLRENPLLPLSALLTVTRRSREFTEAGRMQMFDAQAWALVHFLMFGDQGARAEGLNTFARLVSAGKEPAAAFVEALGPAEALEAPFRTYIQRSIFSFRRYNLDVDVQRERFPVRAMTAAESGAIRALFHVAMGRPVEARATIDEARAADPRLAASYVAEGLLLDSTQRSEDATAAYARAVELETTSAFAYYRLAALTWKPMPDPAALAATEALLARAVNLNTRYAAAYVWIGEVRTALGADGLPMIRRAISLEPLEAAHRLRAARVLLRQGKPDEARTEAQAALALASSEAERRDAQTLLDVIAKRTSG
jgi:tetratricopeptide (TPR) repeat protein